MTKKASDLAHPQSNYIPGTLVKIATQMENESMIDQMLEPSWNQRDNPYNENQAGYAKYRFDGGPDTEFSKKLKKDIMAGGVVGTAGGLSTATIKHMINPKEFSGRKAMLKHLGIGALAGIGTGTMFAAADEARNHLRKQGADSVDNDQQSLPTRMGKGALWEALAGAGGAAIEAPVSRFIFNEKTHLTPKNMLSRIGAGAAIGTLLGAAGGAAGVYGNKKQNDQYAREHQFVAKQLGKQANDVYNTSGDNAMGSGLAEDKNPIDGSTTNALKGKVGAVKTTYPIVSDGDLANTAINRLTFDRG